MKKVELLAPVGSMESLKAAVLNGADAIYLGGKMFSARKYASNFDYEELKEAVDYCHLRNVRVYVTANILIDNKEMKDALNYMKYLYEIHVDGVIVQDFGLANSIRKLFPEMEVHGSTQMTINNLEGAKLLEEQGFTRVVLAREVPIEEIRYIKENSNIELEVFIHGALCVSYSGQCLMSSMIGGRSGNRGSCAQPCRMPSSLVDESGEIIDGFEKKHVLSPRDLNTLEEVKELIDAGVISLKIEGRMKRSEYVATVVKNYRKSIDLGYESLFERDIEDVRQIFNRDFTKGLTFGDFGRNFVSGDRPDNRGIEVGEVVRVDKYKVYIKLNKSLKEGDGIEFPVRSGEYKGLKMPFDASAGETFHLEKPGYVLPDTKVFKTSSMDLLNRAKESFENLDKEFEIDMEVEIFIGNVPKVILKHGEYTVEATIDKVVEEAKKAGLTEEKVKEQLSKLGDTPYKLREFELKLEDSTFLPVSCLNELRRNGIEALDKARNRVYEREIISDDKFTQARDAILSGREKKRDFTGLSVRVSNYDQFKQLDLNKVDRLYLGFTKDLDMAMESLEDYDIEKYIYTDKILYSKDFARIKAIIDIYSDSIDGITANNIGTIKFIKDNYRVNIHGDIGLNAFSGFTINEFEDLGLDSITLSPELHINQIRTANRLVGMDTEILAYGYIPVMTTKHCPMALVKGCKSDLECGSCKFRTGYKLRDRMAMDFALERSFGFTTIYNSVPVVVLDKLKEIMEAGVNYIRLDFTIEDKNIRLIQDAYYDFMNDRIDEEEVDDIKQILKEETEITNGHLFRGVID